MRSWPKHSVTLFGRRTSVNLEEPFWKALREIAESRQQPMKALIEEIERDREFANLSSAIRVFVLQFYKDQFDRRIFEESKIAAQ
jgi:predicted DNA-binding ribbon-helix-helix protein